MKPMTSRFPAAPALAQGVAWLIAAGASHLPATTSLAATAPDSSVSLVTGVTHAAPQYQAGAKFRTPESPETAIAEEAAQGLGTSVSVREIKESDRLALLDARKVNMVLASLPENSSLLRQSNVIPTGYKAGPMAIMRTDTTIKTWDHLKGRTVCIAEGSPYKGMAASRYGAIEKLFPAPADSLLALRIGGCDAAVHDSMMLEQLIQLPEWKKFSARLPVGPRSVLAFITPSHDKATADHLRKVSREWESKRQIAAMNEKRVKHIAFEVYLDQNVPDCH